MEHANDKRKRVRDDLEADLPELKTPRVNSGINSLDFELDPVHSDLNSSESESQLARVDSGESCLNSVIQDDLFNMLDDNDNVAERDSAMQGLDSVIKSFEEEILAPGQGPGSNPVPEFGDLQPNLGYLLEASDDELGLPPTGSAPDSEKPGRAGPEGVDLSGFVGFEDDIPSYDGFGLVAECDGGDGGFVAVDGLFDYAETADTLWRSESLQAM